MKYNKGFAPVLVLIIMLGVLAVGGGAYIYKNKKSDTPSQNIPNDTTNKTTSDLVPQSQATPSNNSTAPSTLKAPTLSKINPTSGSVGSLVTVSGSGFLSGSEVSFGGSGNNTALWRISPKSLSSNLLTFIVPSDAVAGRYVVMVANTSGEWSTTGSTHAFFTVTSQTTGNPVMKSSEQKKLDDGRIANDLKSLASMAEQFYDKNNLTYIGFCSDTYGGVDLIWNDLTARNVSGQSGVRCTTDKYGYAISSTLNSGAYACIDSAISVYANLTSFPSGTKCK